MPTYIVKPDRDADFYLEWSTIVDSPTTYGNRAQYLHAGREVERLDRADEFGTSAFTGDFSWDEDDFIIREIDEFNETIESNAQKGLYTYFTIKRKNLRELMDNLANKETVLHLVDVHTEEN